MKIYPEKEFYNAYGPTECTGISTCYKVREIPTDEDLNIPIGKARENSEIIVLNSNKKMAQVGEVGQLCIRSSSMSNGYLNDEKKTDLAFEKFGCDSVYMTGDYVRKMADGNYIFVGRKDSQVSIQGYRIELGEIEHALRKVANVFDAACISKIKDNDNTTIIVAYIEIDGVCNVQQVKDKLREFLPTYMIPAEIYTLECLPKLSNGKIDRVNLREMSQK
jgi:acyl-coenzyme A synthetase/AMP-(fatty) acid ligase